MKSEGVIFAEISHVFKKADIHTELLEYRDRSRNKGDQLVSEARRILQDDLFSEKKILENLGRYNERSYFLEEVHVAPGNIFSLADIKKICVVYRLKFLESKAYKPGIPYASVLAIKGLNEEFKKELKEFKILAPAASFSHKGEAGETILFARTDHDNWFLVYRWGKTLPWHRKIKYWPMRQFENLFLTVILFTLALTLSLPTGLITLDGKADYWSGYRAAAFFHLLIFHMGVVAYITFAFAKNFSSSIWNREQDF